MDRETGAAISDAAEIAQSVREIIRTVPGDRVMRADYGSELMRLTDVPLNPAGRARITQATAKALATWEPRLRIGRVVFTETALGSVVQEVQGTTVISRQALTVTV
jgi:phage baseplate assembly protein W